MTTDEQSKKWMTKAQIAKHLNCCLRTVTNLMKACVLPYVKVGLVRFDPAECDAAMEKFKRKSQALQ
jgi:hypothetical protein